MEFAHAGKPVGYAKWQSIYPLYINSKRTVKCGRKLPREQAVVDPTIDEIVQALGQLGFKNEENMLKEDKVCDHASFVEFDLALGASSRCNDLEPKGSCEGILLLQRVRPREVQSPQSAR